MAVYTYSIQADTANGIVNGDKLHEQILTSSIVEPLVSIDINGDVLSLTFGQAVDEPTLDTLVAIHDGVERLRIEPALTHDGVTKTQREPREGVPKQSFSVDWTDDSTWWQESGRSTNETPQDIGGGVWQLSNVPVIDVTHGKISQEHRLVGHGVVVRVDGIEQPEKAFAYDQNVTASDGRTMEAGTWEMDYTTGRITTLQGFPAGAISVDYSYSQSSGWLIQPGPGKTLSLLGVEAQFATNIEQNDTVIFQSQIMAAAAAAGGIIPAGALLSNAGSVLDTSYIDLPIATQDVDPANWITDPEHTTKYKNIQDFLNESQRSYPAIPSLGSNARANAGAQSILRWPYQDDARRQVSDTTKTRVRVYLEYDQPFGGSKATITVYAVEE